MSRLEARFGGGGGGGGGDGRRDGLVAMVGVEGCEQSDWVLGTVMYFEPSLLVYLAVLRGDTGVGGAAFWFLAGIVR